MKQSLVLTGLCLSAIFFISCDKVNLPWHHHNDEDTKKKGNNIVCTGNHITFGNGLTEGNTYPEKLLQNLKKHGYSPVAISVEATDGIARIQGMTALLSDYVDPHKISGAKNIVIVTEIVDDTRDNRQSADVSFNLFSEYCKHVQAHGWTVIASTAPYQNPFYINNMTAPFPDGTIYISNSGYDSAGFIAQINEINRLVRKNRASFANGLMDLASDPRLASYNSKYYMPNHMDLTADGAAVVAELAEEALKPHLMR